MGKELTKRLGILQFSASAQRFGGEVYAGGNPGFGPPKTDPCVNGDIARQLNPLRGRGLCITVDSGGRLWGNPPIRQSDNRGLDDAEVQTLYGSQGEDRPRSRTAISRTSRFFAQCKTGIRGSFA